jgi:hypothetical protein
LLQEFSGHAGGVHIMSGERVAIKLYPFQQVALFVVVSQQLFSPITII